MTDDQKLFAAKVKSNILNHGFHATYVGAGDIPSFCYSTGLFDTRAIPELFISSLPPNLSCSLIRQYADRFASGGPIINERISRDQEQFDYYLIPVKLDSLRDLTLASFNFFGTRTFEYLQLVYPDTAGRFPHETGYDYDQQIVGDYSAVQTA